MKLGASGVAVGAIEHEGATVEFGQGATAVNPHTDGSGGTRVNTNRGVATGAVHRRQLPCRAAHQVVAIGHELQPRERLSAHHRDGAGCPLKHAEVGSPWLVDQAIDRGPVGAASRPTAGAAVHHAVGDSLAAIPEADIGVRRRHQYVHLIAHRGLHHQVAEAEAHRHAGDIQAQVGQRPGVVDQAIHPDAEATGIGDVQVAIEGQVAANVEQRGGGRCAKRYVQVAAAGHHQRTGRQRIAAAQGQVAAIVDVQRTQYRAGAGESRAGIDVDIGTAQRTAEVQGACVDVGVAGEAIDAGQVQGAGADLGQGAAATQAAVKGAGGIEAAHRQGVACADLHITAAGKGCQAGIAAHDQRRAGADIGAGGIAQCAGTGSSDAAGKDVQGAGKGVGAAERQVCQAIFVQGASAADHAAERQVVIAGHVQISVEDDPIVQGQRRAVVQCGGASHGQATAAQRRTVTQRQGTGVEGAAAAVGIDAVEGEISRTVLDQLTGAPDKAAQCQALSAADGEVGIQGNAVGQCYRGIAVQRRRAVDCQAAGAEGRIIADGQRAGVQRGAVDKRIDAVKDQVGCAVFHQVAVAADDAAQGQIRRTADRQRAGHADLVAQADGGAGVQTGVGGGGQRTAAQGVVGADNDLAGVERRTALVVVAAVEGQVGRAVLDQTTDAADVAAEGQRIAASEGQDATEVDGIAQGGGGVGVQGGAVGRVQRASAQRGIGADNQGPGIQRRGAGVGVVAIEGQARGAGLDQAARAGDHTTEGQRVGPAGGQVGIEVDRIAQGQRASAVEATGAAHRQCPSAQCRGIAQGQAAGVQGRAALVGVGAVEGQVGRAVLDQLVGATEHAAQGQGVAARHAQVGV